MQNGTNIGKFVDYKLVKSTERKGRDGGLEIYRNTQKIYRNDRLIGRMRFLSVIGVSRTLRQDGFILTV